MATHNVFIFEKYSYDIQNGVASFHYNFDNERHFVERVVFEAVQSYNAEALDRALRLAFLIAGTSYYKCFPTRKATFATIELTATEAALLNKVYREGLGQFMFENSLLPENLVHFSAEDTQEDPVPFEGKGTLALQSGGKDSLLLATMLSKQSTRFSGMYVSSSGTYPHVLDDIGAQHIRTVRRSIDTDVLRQASADGALNGHVPVTYIMLSYGLIDAILHGENTVLSSIGREGAEAHEWIGDLAVNHQWSKTWEAEELLAEHVHSAVSPDIRIGSPLRRFSELRVAELFVQHAWTRFGHRFSSCNLANYTQGHSNDRLVWCGECPKCANSFLLFAPFVEPGELKAIFGDRNLFESPRLAETFKGLLGIDGVMKPFECVGEIAELRQAYHMAQTRYPGIYNLPFEVPEGNFDYMLEGDSQDWTQAYAAA